MTGQRAKLREVWARVPNVHCKGLCAASCGPIGAWYEVRKIGRDR